MTITPELIAATAGLVLSLVFDWVPVLKDWYDQLTPTPKRLIMLALLLLVTLGILAWECRGVGACYTDNWETFLAAFIAALVANQAAHGISPLPAERRAIRANAATHTANTTT